MSKLPLPRGRASTLTGLLTHYLPEVPVPPEDFLREALRGETQVRLMVLSLLMRGYTPEQISGSFGNTRQAVLDMAKKTLRSAVKRFLGLPRYHVKGRQRRVR